MLANLPTGVQVDELGDSIRALTRARSRTVAVPSHTSSIASASVQQEIAASVRAAMEGKERLSDEGDSKHTQLA